MPRPELSAETMSRIRAARATLADVEEFPLSGNVVVENAASRICPSGWAGVVRIGSAFVATVPAEHLVAPVAAALDGLDPGDNSETVEALELGAGVVEVLGPAQLACADRGVFSSTRPEGIDRLAPHDIPVTQFVDAVPRVDAEEAGISSCTSPLFCVSDPGAVVAAAGYRVWCDDIAHMSVLVAPASRGNGLARRVAGAATEHALAEGLIAQWRAVPGASQRVAAALGYVALGWQVSLRFA